MLASASPRRRDLLQAAGLDFDIVPADVDESIDLGLTAGEAARDLALRKAAAVAARLGPGRGPVIGSDTLVVLGEDGSPDRRYLEKAADAAEARSMLAALSGTRHRVITGVAVVPGDQDPLEAPLTGHGTTFVTMRAITPDELEAYVASGEWRGKAGAYAIQETADRFVERLEGDFDNVVGLPVALTLELLRQAAP